MFPGLVDGHMHVGIYSPLAEDAVSESKAAAMGGVTSASVVNRFVMLEANVLPTRSRTPEAPPTTVRT